MSEIRKALEAAGEAVRKALVKPPCCMEGTGCEMPPCHCSQVAASAAVAAFLRALPDYFVMQGHGQPPVPGSIGSGGLYTIAAAVEAAAREADHG